MIAPLSTAPHIRVPWSVVDLSGPTVDGIIQQLLTSQEPSRQPQRRIDNRYPFPHLLSLYPVARMDGWPIGEAIDVVGRHLSRQGLDFYHHQLLPHRHVLVSFHDLPCRFGLVLLVSWCRFLRPGWYNSGGRFTHLVKPRISHPS